LAEYFLHYIYSELIRREIDTKILAIFWNLKCMYDNDPGSVKGVLRSSIRMPLLILVSGGFAAELLA
jgi:hypothetical protein